MQISLYKRFYMVELTDFNSYQYSTNYIKTGMRGMAARNDLSTYFRRLKKETIFAQCSWRRTMARRELRKLKMVLPLLPLLLYLILQTLENCKCFSF